jgi:hypothetical protein
MHAAVLYGINWYPEIRGITTVMIAVSVLCGGVYLLLGTNLGARLGFLVALAGLFGWMTLMAGIWAVYGIGLKGREATWKPKEIIVGDVKLATNNVAHDLAKWRELPSDDSGYGQANASSDDILTNQAKYFTSTAQYKTLKVYDLGGQKYPRLGPYHPDHIKYPWKIKSVDFDQLAFFHKTHYALVEVQPLLSQNTEPGKAPPTATADPSKPPVYVLMVRDLGAKRLPAFGIMFGSGLIFFVLVYMLHARDKLVMARTAQLPALTRASS